MDALLFLNGTPPSRALMESIDFSSHYTVCADGAYAYLKEYCTPDVLVGDFDSLKDDTPKAAKIVRLAAEKDYTDGHIGLLEAIEHGAKKVRIYGALGGRPDHELCNYLLLEIAREKGVAASIETEGWSVFLTDKSFRARVKIGSTVSVVPFEGSLHIISTKGLKYAVSDKTFTKATSQTVSNVAEAEEIEYILGGGVALVFLQNDGGEV